MKKLNARKLLFLPKDKYHDGDGLYITISSPGKGKWSFRYTIISIEIVPLATGGLM